VSDKARAAHHGGIEQQRRDFKAAEPDLYAYITAHEGARILDSAGDTLSGASDGPQAANRLWRLAQTFTERKKRMLKEHS
jgi:hypothetical protein